MSTPSDRRRALRVLAGSPNGVTESMLLAHGFTSQLIAELLGAGLAIASTESVGVGGRTIEVARLRITDAGRKAIGA